MMKQLFSLKNATYGIAILAGTLMMSCDDNDDIVTDDVDLTALVDPLSMESEIVDLGLSVKWRSYNIGATYPEEIGDYYMWGDTRKVNNIFDDHVSFLELLEEDGELNEKYETNNDSFYLSDIYIYKGKNLGSSISGTYYDTAKRTLGNIWRMPTKEEFQELIDSCKWKCGHYNGVYGLLGTRHWKQTIDGKDREATAYIFFPAAGYYWDKGLVHEGVYGGYWTATQNASNMQYAYTFDFGTNVMMGSNAYRYYGIPIRPVTDY